MRELDKILEGFVDNGYAALSAAEKELFAEILEYPDPDLHAYLIGNAEPMNPELAALFRHIRATVSA